MQFTSEQHLADGSSEREFTIANVPGILWTPASAAPSAPVPVILMGHPGVLHQMHARLAARALHSAAQGFATATIELPGAGGRPALPAVERHGALPGAVMVVLHGIGSTADRTNWPTEARASVELLIDGLKPA